MPNTDDARGTVGGGGFDCVSLETGEAVLDTDDLTAYDIPIHGIYGRLYLTDRRLIWVGKPSDDARSRILISIRDITSVSLVPAGGYGDRIELALRDGSRPHRFRIGLVPMGRSSRRWYDALLELGVPSRTG